VDMLSYLAADVVREAREQAALRIAA
jgi:hypothetical protein